MVKLVYSATTGDGRATEGYVDAANTKAARASLQRRGFRDIVLRPEPVVSPQDAVVLGLDEEQIHHLARFKERTQRRTGLTMALWDTVAWARWWYVLALCSLAYGLWAGVTEWVLVGPLLALLPFAAMAWSWRRAGRYQALLQEFATGNWAAMRGYATLLRAVGLRTPMLAFDLDVRLASADAREGRLAQALPTLAPWQARYADWGGLYEGRVAGVYLAAEDHDGFMRLIRESFDRSGSDPMRRLDHALAQARFGDAAEAAAQLEQVAPDALLPVASAYLTWARGLVQLRSRQSEACATLGAAVAQFLRRETDPAVWTALAMCTCDHAIALTLAGRKELARQEIGAVWPVLKAHASTSLLRMLEADDLLPLTVYSQT